MRLHTLELQAIGPYATMQRIDFERLSASGLFLLEGPTGAGKTTILDAITFALYGGLSGDTGTDRLRSHFAGPHAEPQVTLELSLAGVRYRVRRTPEYDRPKRRGEGTTRQAASVHLERLEGGGWTSLSANKAEAGELITEAVGLNRDQFTQVMLLPQGEFARFLRSSDDDRRVLLTKLFGTQLFDRITAELERRRHEVVKTKDAARARIGDAVSAAAEAAGLDAAERAELLALGRADQATRLKEVAEELASHIEVTSGGLEIAAARLTQAQAAAGQRGTQATLMTRLTRALAQLTVHEATRPEHDTRSALLAAARQANPVRPLLDALADAQDVSGQARTALDIAHEAAQVAGPLAPSDEADPSPWPGIPGPAELAAEPVAAQPGAGQLDLGLFDSGRPSAALPGQDGDPQAEDPSAGDPRDGAAQAVLAEAGAATSAARLLGTRAADAEALAASLQHLADSESALPDQTAALTAARQEAIVAAERAAKLEADRVKLPAAITEAEEQLSAARIAAAGLPALADRLGVTHDRHDAAIRGATLAGQLTDREDTLRAAVDAHQDRVDAFQQAMTQRLENMAAELADRLADGGPCPVCGSTEHPGPASHLADAVSADDVAGAERERDAAALRREQAQADRDQVAEQVAEAQAAAGGASAGALAAEVAELTGQIEHAQEAAAQTARLEPELADLRAERDRLAEDLRAAAAAEAAAAQRAAELTAALDRLTAIVSAAAGEYPTVAARQVALTARRRRPHDPGRLAPALAAALTAQARARVSAPPQSCGHRLRRPHRRQPRRAAADRAGRPGAPDPGLDHHADELHGGGPGRRAVRPGPGHRGRVNAVALTTSAEPDRCQAAERDVRDALHAWTAKDERLRQRMTELGPGRGRRRPAGRRDRSRHPAGRAGQGHGGHRRDRADHLRAAPLVRPGGAGRQRPAVGHVRRPL